MSENLLLEGKNSVKALKLLHTVTECLEKNNIPYWLEGGTLLGVVRENRLLPWDDDLDISVKDDDYDKVIRCLKKIKKLGWRVRTKSFENDDTPFVKDNVRIIKIRTRKLYFFRGKICLEIFLKFKKDDKYYWRVAEKRKSVPAFFYKDFIEWPFNGKYYPVPKKYDEYLTYRYGDWRTPVKEWDTYKDDNALN